MKKTVPVPLVAMAQPSSSRFGLNAGTLADRLKRSESTADSATLESEVPNLTRTRELPVDVDFAEPQEERFVGQGTPASVVEQDITVPVQSSIESSLTFEVLRRQSEERDDDSDESSRKEEEEHAEEDENDEKPRLLE